ncbi:chromate transporter [Chitinimonas sp.]|uniref:chromate transporter n=1 Tax=Chitinimonas sp. TaxID=1934313 RepID=UPI0035AED638
MNPSLLQIALLFGAMSLMAVGGANVLLPELHRQVVELHGWMSGSEFASLFAIAQASPGPNVLVVTLIGWRLAGLPGALVSTLAMCLPSSLLTFAVAKLWQRFKDNPWRRAIERGLAPITIGLVLGSGLLLGRAADHGALAWGLSGATALVASHGKLNPLWLLAAGAACGLAGWV